MIWWTFATALATPGADASLATVLDEDASTRDRIRATRKLGRLDPDDPAVPEVVTPLAGELQAELPEKLPGAIRKTLGRLDASSVWTAELSSPDRATRRRAANLLGQEGPSRAAGATTSGAALVAVLDDPAAGVREAAAGALVAFPETDAVAELSDCLEDPVIAVRLAASQTLGFLGGERALAALQDARAGETNVVVQHYLDAAMGHIARQAPER